MTPTENCQDSLKLCNLVVLLFAIFIIILYYHWCLSNCLGFVSCYFFFREMKLHWNQFACMLFNFQGFCLCVRLTKRSILDRQHDYVYASHFVRIKCQNGSIEKVKSNLLEWHEYIMSAILYFLNWFSGHFRKLYWRKKLPSHFVFWIIDIIDEIDLTVVLFFILKIGIKSRWVPTIWIFELSGTAELALLILLEH
jgi:hypothetical protein